MTSTGDHQRRLPHGYVARIRPDLLRNTGTLLVGGSPLRAMRLTDRAQKCIEGDLVMIRDNESAAVAARLLDGNLADPEPYGLPLRPAEITVVVPVRDRPEQLDRCLQALEPLVCVVVDDASRDGASVAAVAGRHGAGLISLAHNVGPAAARNAGLAHVRTPFAAFVDSDVEIPSDQLIGLAAHFADQRVALLGPLVRGFSRSPRPRWFERYDMTASSLDLGGLGARVQPGSTVAWLPSACLIGRTEVLNSLNGFDDRMRIGEDVDLVWRLVRTGAIVRYDPRWVARHDTRNTVREWLGRKFWYGTGGAALAQRHGEWTAPAIMSPVTALGAAAVLMRLPQSVPIAALSFAISTRALRRTLPGAQRSGVPLLAADVAFRGLGWGVRQESSLLLRHWWPASAVAALASRRARRMLVTALIVDAVDMLGRAPGPHPFTSFMCRRLDDLAYGAGLWFGAIRARSITCLLPRTAQRLRTRPQ